MLFHALRDGFPKYNLVVTIGIKILDLRLFPKSEAFVEPANMCKFFYCHRLDKQNPIHTGQQVAQRGQACTTRLTCLNNKPASSLPYQSVVMDEVQDMGSAAFKLLRVIVPPGENEMSRQNDIVIPV